MDEKFLLSNSFTHLQNNSYLDFALFCCLSYVLLFIYVLLFVFNDSAFSFRHYCITAMPLAKTKCSDSTTSRLEKWCLIKGHVDDIKGAKLPSNQRVLVVFIHLYLQQDETVNSSATSIVEKVAEFWTFGIEEEFPSGTNNIALKRWRPFLQNGRGCRRI